MTPLVYEDTIASFDHFLPVPRHVTIWTIDFFF